MSAMRVCIFTETYFPVVGGGETQARLLAEELHALGIATWVLTRRSDAALAKEEMVGDTAVTRLPPVGSGQLKKWGLVLTSLPALLRQRRDFDVLFVSGFRIMGITAVFASKLLGKKCVLKADSLGEMSGDFFAAGLARFDITLSSRLFRLFLNGRNRILRRADAFVAISSDIAAELRQSGVSTANIRRIPNGIDTDRFRPATPAEKATLRRKLRLPGDHTLIIYTGRLVTYKGLPLLLNVWREIRPSHPKTMLILVGAGGLDMHNCEAELKAYVAEHKLANSVIFTGGVRNVEAYLQAADIFVFPTENEAFGISLIEAMACALPVVTTAVGGVKDIVQDGHNGLVIPSGKAAALAACLTRLLSDAPLAARLGRNGRETAQTRYAAAQVTASYAALFQELVRQNKPEAIGYD